MASKKSRIMYIEQKTGAQAGEARIGRVSFSRTGRTLYYKDKAFATSSGSGIYGNYLGFDRKTFEEYVNAKQELDSSTIPGYLGEFWISGPKKNGQDRHPYEPCDEVVVDEDVAEEYWREIRGIDAPRPKASLRD